MEKKPSKRKGLLRIILAGALSPLLIGCGGGVVEVAAVVVLIKLVAAGAFAILSVAGAYWFVESARLDAAKKELILQGMKDGKSTLTTLRLSDEQLKTIEQKGKLKIQFEDGKEVEVDVTK